MQDRLDLFELAAKNGPALEAQFDSEVGRMSGTPREHALRFAAEIAQEGQISMNRRLTDLRTELEDGHFSNAHQKASLRARRSSKTKVEIMQAEDPAYYTRRQAFHEAVQDEHKFTYGALNTGGLGASDFGEFCVVVAPDRLIGTHSLAYLQGDSLQTYVELSGAVNAAKLTQECATDQHKHHLCVLKHLRGIAGCAPENWPALVCNSGDYLETIIGGQVSLGHVAAIRMSRFDHDLYYDFAFEETRRSLSELDRSKAGDFERALDLMERKSIALEVPADA